MPMLASSSVYIMLIYKSILYITLIDLQGNGLLTGNSTLRYRSLSLLQELSYA